MVVLLSHVEEDDTETNYCSGKNIGVVCAFRCLFR